MMRHGVSKTWGFAAIVAVSLLLYMYHRLDSPMAPAILNADKGNVLNVVHMVWIVNEPDANLYFQFKHYLSIYAAWHYWGPRALYLHTNAGEAAISRARDGVSGKWDKLAFALPLTVKHFAVPSHAENGVEIQGLEHKSDFVRVQVVRDFGGIYLDFDAHALRDIRVLRESGFNAIGGRQLGGQVISGTFMSTKGGKMISRWYEEMHRVYDGKWTTHSNDAITRISQRLVADAGEMLIIDQDALAPGSWLEEDCRKLLQVYYDGSNQGDKLPSPTEITESTDGPDDHPSWAQDWSSTYLLHAYKGPDDIVIQGFDDITPRYVLERQSNFARAVYPIAKDMYQKGLITADDSHLEI